MEELFKKVYIKTETDLPKEGDLYAVNHLNDNNDETVDWEGYDPFDSDYKERWLNKVIWYLAPIEQPFAPVNEEESYWWCPACNVIIPGRDVTFHELHDLRVGGCGNSVIAKFTSQFQSKPSDSQKTVTDEEIEKYFTSQHYDNKNGHHYRINKDRIFGAKAYRDGLIKGK